MVRTPRGAKSPRPSKTKKGAAPEPFWQHDVEEAPRADVTIAATNERRIKWTRRYLKSAAFLFPVALLAVIANMSAALEEEPAPEVQQVALDTPTKSAAILAVETWLAADPSPLPGGSILSWDGADRQAEPALTVNPANNQTEERQGLELHHLTVKSPSGTTFETTVQVGFSEVRGAQVIGAPTLVPSAPSDTSPWPNLKSWPTLVPVSATDPMNQSASAWVKALTSGDPNTLRLAIGDTDAAHSYIPLSGAEASDIKIEEVGAIAPAEATTEIVTPGTVVARVSFGVSWEGQEIPDGKVLSRLTYDVLMQKADTGAPVIVAWGGAGTGEFLKPYQNAVEGREITADAVKTEAGA